MKFYYIKLSSFLLRVFESLRNA